MENKIKDEALDKVSGGMEIDPSLLPPCPYRKNGSYIANPCQQVGHYRECPICDHNGSAKA